MTQLDIFNMKKFTFYIKKKKPSLPQSSKPTVVWPLVTSLQPLPSLLPFLTVLQPQWLFSSSLEKLNFFPLRGLEGFNIHECLPQGALVWPLLPQSKLDPVLHSSQHLIIPFVASPTLSELKCCNHLFTESLELELVNQKRRRGHSVLFTTLSPVPWRLFFPWIFMEFLGGGKGCARC